MKSFAKILVLLSAAMCLASVQAKTRLRLCMPVENEDFLNLSLLVAQDQKSFEQQGLDVQISVIRRKTGKSAFTMSSAGPLSSFSNENWGVADQVINAQAKCDVGISPVAGMMALQDKDLALLQPLYMSTYGQDYDTHLIVRNDSLIKSVKDLRGKVVRIGQVPTHMALNGVLKDSGMRLNDVILETTIPANHVLAALDSGRIHAAITYVPTMPLMLASGKVRVLSQNIIGRQVMAKTPNALMFTSRKFAAEHAEVLSRFRAAMTKNLAQIERDPGLIFKSAHRLFRGRNGKSSILNGLNPAWQERAATLVGKLSLEDFSSSNQEALNRNLMDYQRRLFNLGYISKISDISGWFPDSKQKQAAL
ncbi:MAG: ABC transporter substrate-binding protein [Bdellovibrionales bacterium]